MKQFKAHDDRSLELRHSWTRLSDRAMVRMAALMGGHEWLRWPGDRVNGRKRPVQARKKTLSRSEASKRQDALLDEALSQTFPASDPVSIAGVS